MLSPMNARILLDVSLSTHLTLRKHFRRHCNAEIVGEFHVEPLE